MKDPVKFKHFLGKKHFLSGPLGDGISMRGPSYLYHLTAPSLQQPSNHRQVAVFDFKAMDYGFRIARNR
jgi:hypothetical protein